MPDEQTIPTEAAEPDGQEENPETNEPNDETIAGVDEVGEDEAPVEDSPDMETKTMSLAEQQEIAKTNNWHRLGEKTLMISTPLGDEEKMKLAEEMSTSMMSIESLQLEKKAFDSEIGDRIKDHQRKAIAFAHQIKLGAHQDEMLLPVFLDTATNERVYVDPETKEVIERSDSLEEDKQIALM